ncbi:hypothetical protein C4K16_6099 [Pseudomonas chlororaphis subsp. aurantiaca]|nr:hypothetical protein C4K17_6365 [Pseudomonas chlororaphis subsp. aurantiaca]AZD76414.1 hypothetical protein C4K16_6099 [Pseudomonas chlororaphis subsp. aurantiaca]AZD82670.1 hypothetical protein C4K15_6148 [Pseudomonas chlororaphis subsp. aurantiaca]
MPAPSGILPGQPTSAHGIRHPKPAAPEVSIYLTEAGQTPLLCSF